MEKLSLKLLKSFDCRQGAIRAIRFNGKYFY